VDGPNSPYLRTKVTQPVPQSGSAAVAVRNAVTSLSSAPDTSVLLNAANLYRSSSSPISDGAAEQASARGKGSVVAQAAFASATPYGHTGSPPIPIINVTAYAAESRDALKLTEDTVAAFHLWPCQQAG